jgi:hypothetical protein
MQSDIKRRKRILIIALVGILFLTVLVVLVGPGWLKSQTYTGPQAKESEDIVYLESIILKPLVDSYNETVDLFRPSNFRNFDWPGFACLFLPNNPQRIPGGWFRETFSYCY